MDNGYLDLDDVSHSRTRGVGEEGPLEESRSSRALLFLPVRLLEYSPLPYILEEGIKAEIIVNQRCALRRHSCKPPVTSDPYMRFS